MISSYLKYLKEISRKIVTNNGFENVLLGGGRQNRAFTFQVEIDKLVFDRNDKEYAKIQYIEDYLQRNNHKKLFCGFGMVAGTKGRTYAAPILFTECTLEKIGNSYLIEIDNGKYSFNYDLITSILNYGITSRYNISEDEDFNEDFQKEVDLVDKIETEIESLKSIEDVIKLSKKAIALLRENSYDFNSIGTLKNEYSYEKEYELFAIRKNRQKKKNKDIERERESIFETELTYIDSLHIYVSSIPNQLSTYEALKQLIAEVDINNFQNKILEKLLINTLTDTKLNIKYQNNTNIEEIIKKYIPLDFSDSQINAIKNAFNSEISYIQGPPGTGKSYTIGAMVLISLFLDKRVLVVSQKEPALEVIKEKIESFLTDNNANDFQAITYFKNTNKSDLRHSIQKLQNRGLNQVRLYVYLEQRFIKIEETKTRIDILLSEIGTLEGQLYSILNYLFEHNEKHNEFIRQRDWFINHNILINSFVLDENYKFHLRKLKPGKFKKSISIYNEICYVTPSISTEFYKYKFRKSFNQTFNIDTAGISDANLGQFCNDLIEVYQKHIESRDIANNIKKDIEDIRNRITHLKNELKLLQKKLLKMKFDSNTLSNISEDYEFDANKNLEELSKLDKLLYWKKPSLIAEKMKDIDFSRIIEIMPFWLAEVRHLGQILPMQAELFDLIVVDEASQVNLAEILPAFYRGKQIVVVGDHNQLGLDSTGVNFKLSSRFDLFTWEKNFRNFGITFNSATEKQITVTKCSILDFIRSPFNNAYLRTEMLQEHFRSMPALAWFTNNNYYDGLLKIMSETPDKVNKASFHVVQVDGERDQQSKIILSEATKIVTLVKKITSAKLNKNSNIVVDDFIIPGIKSTDFTIGIISLMTNQRNLIEDLIEENLSPDIIIKHKIEVWTPQSAQGNERDIILISLGLDANCSGRGNYHKNPRLLNVATSRARKFTIVVHCDFQKEKYTELAKYINLTNRMSSWTLNHNLYESEFEKKVYEYLIQYVRDRNLQKTVKIFNQVETCGQRRLDFVLHNVSNDASVAVEVDGIFHYKDESLSREYCEEHNDRIEILKRAGWNIINTPYYKWYSNGWLSESNHSVFKKEIERIYRGLDEHLKVDSTINSLILEDNGFPSETIDNHVENLSITINSFKKYKKESTNPNANQAKKLSSNTEEIQENINFNLIEKKIQDEENVKKVIKGSTVKIEFFGLNNPEATEIKKEFTIKLVSNQDSCPANVIRIGPTHPMTKEILAKKEGDFFLVSDKKALYRVKQIVS